MSTTMELSPLRMERSPSRSSPNRNSRDVTEADSSTLPSTCPVRAVSMSCSAPAGYRSVSESLVPDLSDDSPDTYPRNSSPPRARSPPGISSSRVTVSMPLEYSMASPLLCNGSISTSSSFIRDSVPTQRPNLLICDKQSVLPTTTVERHEDGAYFPKQRTSRSSVSPVFDSQGNSPGKPSMKLRDDNRTDGDEDAEEEEEEEADEEMEEDGVDIVEDDEDDDDNEARICSDREEDDQVECAECSVVFRNLQLYMDHTCQRASGSGITRQMPMSHETEGDDGQPIVSIHLDCTLVYDLDDNLYVVEGNEWSKTMAKRNLHLRDKVLVIRDDQGALNLERALPAVSKVIFVPSISSSRLLDAKSERSTLSGSSGMETKTPVMACLLHDLRSSHADHLVKLSASQKMSFCWSTQIRLCCVCKASYTNSKAFLHHAIIEHSIDVSHLDRVALEATIMGGIIHRQGASKSVTVAFLSPDSKSDPSSHFQFPSANFPMAWETSDNVHRRLAELGVLTRHGQYLNGASIPHERERSRILTSNSQGSKATFPYEDSIPPHRHQPDASVMNKLAFGQSASQKMRASVPSAIRASMKPDGFYKTSMPSLMTMSDKFNQTALVKSSSDFVAHESGIEPRSSPLPLSPKRLPSSSLPPLMASTSTSGNSSFHGLSISSMATVCSASVPAAVTAPMTMQMSSFLGSCDEHPQGRALGVECPKCDMVLGSSQSLGGHMSMSHSRNSCKTLKCPKCNWHYKYQETLEIHMKEKHPDSDAQCVYCLTNQPHPRLARGESYSCGYKPYRCEVCNYSTTTKGNLSIHMQSDKHINNMQDLANGNGELKMPAQPSPATQSLPPSSSAAMTSNAPAFSQDESQNFKKVSKQKQSFRCDVCSYETSVARNLRIHMTSEKHTHNMLVMTQSINHLHQDMTLHQMSQMNQLLALSQQDNQARFAVLGSHIPAGMFPYDQAAMLMSTGANPPSGFEIPINLTKENTVDEWMDGGYNQDASKMFQCCICNKYSSDSMENVHNHIQFDRTKSANSDAFITFSHGTYHCNLCTYKTHLKANFQLHCKTDKHVQKLQIVLHMQEGGPENDWRSTQPNPAMQICCNACSYFANSTHKMHLHLASMQHEACAQLFRHLQLLERSVPPPVSGRQRYYHCSLCPANVRTKQKLVFHSRSARHLRAEHTIPQRHVSIFEVFLVKDFGEGDQVDFDDVVANQSPEGLPPVDTHDATTLPTPGTLHKNNGIHHLEAKAPVSQAQNQTVNGSNPLLYHASNESWADDQLIDSTRPFPASTFKAAQSNRPCIGNPNNSNGNAISNTNTSFSTYGTNGRGNITNGSGHGLNNSNSNNVQVGVRAHPTSPICILCPLCRHECSDRHSLELHLSLEHNVAPEGLSKLMLVVDWPTGSTALMDASNSSATPHIPSPSSPPPPSSTPMASATAATSPVSSSLVSQQCLAASTPATTSRPFLHPTSSASASSPSPPPPPPPSLPTSLSVSCSEPDQVIGEGDASTAHSSSSNELSYQTCEAVTVSIDQTVRGSTSASLSTSSSLPQPSPPSLSPLPVVSLPFSSSLLPLSQPSPSSSSSSSSMPNHKTSSLNTLTVTATSTTPTTALVSTGKTALNLNSRVTWEESPVARVWEINADLLEEEHTRLLKEGVDTSLQDWEDLFRCQTCSKSFANIDQLYAHQNELGHLELKQTPRGPGYLCWKKGCNQYFKTASALQMHFKEIHVKKASAGVVPVKELEQYTFKCDQCTYSFKNRDTLQRHILVHLAHSVTRCRICSKGFSSIEKLKKHLDMGHGDLTPLERSVQIESVEINNVLVQKNPIYASFTSELCLFNGNESSHCDELDMTVDESIHQTTVHNSAENPDKNRERQFLEDYINSQALAETNYLDYNRKYKCHACQMAFTKQSYLISHETSIQHQEKAFSSRERSLTPSMAPHLLQVKGAGYLSADIPKTTGTSMISNPPSNLSLSMVPMSTSLPNGNHSGVVPESGGTLTSKPYRCNICQVSYAHAPGLEIHMRSVAHKTCVNKLGELIQTGQVDVNQSLIDHPDPKVIGKQQAQLIADIIHQQASAQAQAASNAAASLYGLQGLNLNAMAQISMLQGAMTTGGHLLPQTPQSSLSFSASQLEAYETVRNSSMLAPDKDVKDVAPQINSDVGKSALDESNADLCHSAMKVNARPDLTDKIINMVIKQDGKIEPVEESRMKQMPFDDKQVKSSHLLSNEMKTTKKEDEPLPPNFPHAPVLTRPRGFMGRFKPQLHRSLLENFGFECVMHFNEENSSAKKGEKAEEHPFENNDSEDKKKGGDEDKKKGGDESCEAMETDDKDQEKKNENVEVEQLDEDCEEKLEENKDDKKDENKENIDLPELNKTKCSSCSKYFSSVWVLKNHEEEVHSHFVSPEMIEVFGNKFREEWEKTLPKTNEQNELTLAPQTPVASNPTTPTVEKTQSSDMPPPPPPSHPQLPANLDMAQLLPLMGMNLLPMHLPMSLVNLGLQTSLMPSLMMPPSLDLSQTFLSQMPPPPLVDTGNVNSQQQLKAAAVAAAAAAAQAQNQKRVRTRISDDQLKVLRQYFDINNSPSEEQINKMAEQTGLPQKVIKHWFRNTLFKERQRNKDSPYNFNNPPSTSIDLDEYDRTGKIPEVKVEAEEEEESPSSVIHEDKKEPVKEESFVNSHLEKEIPNQDLDILSTVPLKIDLTPRMEMSEDAKRENDSYSNTSSPSNASSIPSTPTASAPSTPTPVMNSAPVSANPLAFSLDAYAANIARMEATSFQNIGKRANRTRFTDHQIKTLQDYFERNAYPKDDELEHLSRLLGLSARVIVVWFQNARQKARKIYENQPNSDVVCTKDAVSPFQRTPGLNYQCKKCHSVFQRYYELIKHQKNCCFNESNNNTKTIPPVADEDSNSRNSVEESSALADKRMLSFNRDTDPMSRMHNPDSLSASIVSSIATAKLPSSSIVTSSCSASSSSSASSFPSSSSSPIFRCDKCSLTFSRFDMYQDHQKAHNIAPAMFTPFSSSSAFGMLQTLAHQEDTKAAVPSTVRTSPGMTHPSLPSTPNPAAHQTSSATPCSLLSSSPSPTSKRKTDSEDEGGDQPRDKRLRTTILPEQLDYLYQQYQIDCNPSRKQLEHIASTVNLKKRVVQVWFQNTRARERKGHYRAHQQLINKRCPFCRALFRAKSALESHLATKHPEEMAKGDINIDLIPDAVLDISHPSHGTIPKSSLSCQVNPDMAKLLPPATAANMPNYMALMQSAAGLNFPFSEGLGHSSFEDPFFKKYMSELAHNAARKDHMGLTGLNKTSTQSSTASFSAHKPTSSSSPAPFPSPRPVDAHKPKTSSLPSPAAAAGSSPSDDAPLDLSKPVKPTAPVEHVGVQPKSSLPTTASELMERSVELDYFRRLNNLDDSFSETHSEVADQDYMNEEGNSSPSPSRSAGSGSLTGTPGGLNSSNSSNTPNSYNNASGTGKRYRTQMSATQVKVMKHLFMDYKTPTMAECELLGQEIGLAKRVVQVWFQNARAKEKKAKLSSGKPYNPELDFPKSPEECKLCNYKYSHKVTVQDHIFTKAHIDRVKKSLRSEGDRDFEYPSTSMTSGSRSSSQEDSGRKMWDSSLSNAHLAQLQAMGLSPGALGLAGLGNIDNNKSQEPADSVKKEKKAGEGAGKEQQTAMEIAMNAQMVSALNSYMPGLDPAYLSYMYGGLPGYFPAMGLPMMQPGLIPSVDPMMNFDPLAFGTPLAFLQIPAAAIKSVSEKLLEPGSILARYTQDCQALADLHSVVSAVDLTVAAEATLDVGYICKKCQMVYPAKESCITHQRTGCLATQSALPKGFESIIKLEQVQYECRACNERFSTIAEFKGHCQQEAHRSWLMKYKSREAARQEGTGSPSYASSSNCISSPSPLSSYTPLKPSGSPTSNNNNNNNNTCNNNTSTSSQGNPISKSLSPSPAHQLNKMLSSNLFMDKGNVHFNHMSEMQRLKAE